MLFRKNIVILLSGAALAGLLWLAVKSASVKSGALVGKITTSGGRAVPRAEVTALHAKGQVSVSAVTNSMGVYEICYLPAGSYNLEIRKAGFVPVDKPAVNLQAWQTLTIDAVLVPAGP